MRRFSWFWRIGIVVATAVWLAVAWADEPQEPAQPAAAEPSALEKLIASQPPEKSHRRKPAKKTPSSRTAPPQTQPLENEAAKRGNGPFPFTSKEGIEGWSIIIPGNQALATPAVAEGKVFIGGGYSSHDFGALDAKTGKMLWHYVAADNGPTAPVVDSGHVTFNTESCELEVLTTAGVRVWKKWLGNSLLSTPAVANGRVIAAYPVNNGSMRYGLAAFGLEDGRILWQKGIPSEIITAPVIVGQRVFVATVDGTLFCVLAKNGTLVWAEQGANATSAPTVWGDRCWFSRRQEIVSAKSGGAGVRQTEQVAVRGLGIRADMRGLTATSRLADYLDCRRAFVPVGAVAAPPAPPTRPASRRAVASRAVSRGGIRPVADDSDPIEPLLPGYSVTRLRNADMLTAQTNLGLIGMQGIWSYQGSRPLFYKGRLYAALGDSLSCIDAKTEKVLWKKAFRPGQTDIYTIYKEYNNPTPQEETKLLAPTIAPPALVNDKVFVGTSYGEVVCLSAATGEILWLATIDAPIASQPVVAHGRVYVGTKTGRLFCLETGDREDHGWLMWGANAAHTGSVGEEGDETDQVVIGR